MRKFFVTAAAVGIASLPVLTGCSMSSDGGSGDANYPGEGGGGLPGVVSAGEWNDLSNWTFWGNLLTEDDYSFMPGRWLFHTNNRISIQVTSDGNTPVVNARVALKQGTGTICLARTDNKGRAELWVGLNDYHPNEQVDFSTMSLEVNDTAVEAQVTPYDRGICHVSLPAAAAPDPSIEVAFMVDATGSMTDELEFLKTELTDVVNRVEGTNPGLSVKTAAVFYRDFGDDYVTRESNFTDNITTTRDFISLQRAMGGGDREEAVDVALEKSLSTLQWTGTSRARILFILLDAPPHYTSDIVANMNRLTDQAMEMGVRIVPVVASGADKETEFLMRFLSIATNGTYVFITDHSGVGDPHLIPSVGEYTVEPLNDLIVRLINDYSK
jgi:hypothetical protein